MRTVADNGIYGPNYGGPDNGVASVYDTPGDWDAYNHAGNNWESGPVWEEAMHKDLPEWDDGYHSTDLWETLRAGGRERSIGNQNRLRGGETRRPWYEGNQGSATRGASRRGALAHAGDFELRVSANGEDINTWEDFVAWRRGRASSRQ